jgi:hypothetical protein
MSLTLNSLILDLRDFAAVQGSGDGRALEFILSARAEDIADHDAMAGVTMRGEPSLAVLIARIVRGDIRTDDVRLWRYEHAAVEIADALGSPLPSDALSEVSPVFWREVNQAIARTGRKLRTRSPLGIRPPTFDELLVRGPLLTIPHDPTQRLGSGFLTSFEVSMLAPETARFRRPEYIGSVQWPDETLDALGEYVSWIETAAAYPGSLFLHL